jgi:hypothetical protein
MTQDGEVECWGAVQDGQAEVPEDTYSTVAPGYFHTCAIRGSSRGSVRCWGSVPGRDLCPVGPDRADARMDQPKPGT